MTELERDLVGRDQELRVARQALASARAGLVIHGIGGVGKSTLAAELISRADAQHVVIPLRGAVSADAIFDEVGARLTMTLAADRQDAEGLLAAAQHLRASDIDWTDRWRVLAELILPVIPTLVLLDNFEENLHDAHVTWGVRDPELGDLLARWARRPGQSKLLVTTRHSFELPGGAHRYLEHLHLGPLSEAETAKLVWQLPGLDALSDRDRARAYRDVGGHPRTLEYLGALLQSGRTRFHDVAERMEQRLAERGFTDPGAWMPTGDRALDDTLAEAVTLAVDDVVLQGLLDEVARTRLARELAIAASVYRVPVDDTALVWQLATETESPTDPARQARMTRMQTAIEAALEATGSTEQLTPTQLGLTAEDLAVYQADIGALQRPPVSAPDGFAEALAAAQAAGLIAPVKRSNDTTLYVVHSWTAHALEQLQPELVTYAHHRAARYWRWRVQQIPQSPSDDIEQLIEARHHHHAAGEDDAALQLSDHVILQLQTWGQYGRAMQLCQETLQWVSTGSARAAAYIHQLALLAQLRGDYDTAEQRYIQALEINERLGDQAGLASGYHQLGMLAQDRGDYDTAERRYSQSLEINERLGNQAGLATSYHQLGTLAQDLGRLDNAEDWYRRSLTSKEQLGDQPGMASSYHQLAVLAQLRGDYDTAEQRYIQALEINERLGDQAGLASGYHQLGMLAQDRGDYDTAERRYTQALEINERLGDQAGLATSYHQLGIVAQDRVDYDTAEQRYTQSLQIDERLGNQAGMASSYHQLAVLARLRGDYDTAEQRYIQALEINERLGDQARLASGYHQLGMLAQDRGDYDTAEQRYTQALEIDERLGNQAGLATSYHQLAVLARLRGAYDTAERRYTQALEISELLGDQAGLAAGYHQLAVLAQLRGDYDTAEQRYIQALEINERLGNPAGLASGYHQLGMLAQDRGDYDTAEYRYTQSLEIDERLGNQAGLASSHATLAMLMTERDDDEQAIGYDLRALAIRLQMGDRQVIFSAQRLIQARSRLGAAAFTRIVSQFVDETSLKNLSELLDSYEQHDADTATNGG